MAVSDVECCDFYQVHDDVVKAVKEKMPDEDELYDLAEIFKVLAIPRELRFFMYCLNRRCACATLPSC